MAEDAAFSGMSSGDAAKSFASVISKIKSDMAAIERSAKNIEQSLSKASRANLGGGGASFGAQNAGGNTGAASRSAFGAGSLGAITSQLGGVGAVARTASFAGGALAGGLGVGGGGAIAGGIAVAGLPDLIMRPERALNMEAARFGMAQATGDFGSFKRMMDGARNSFNVQNEQAFMNTMVYGTQRAGMVGLNGGGTVGERRAAAQIGGYNTLAGMAGIDQSQVPGVMQSMMGAPAYYASMAAGIQTRNPVTGETIGIEGQGNQLFAQKGYGRMNQEKALTQIDIDFGVGSSGYQQLLEQYGGDTAAADMMVETLRLQARQGGKPLKENQVQEQAKAMGEAGGLGTEMTQGMEGTRALESAKMNMGEEYLNDATAGIEEATKHITNAVDMLAELEGPLRDIVGAYTTLANQLDVFNTELPGATKGITDFFTGLPGLLMMNFGGGGKGGMLSKAGSLLSKGKSALPWLGRAASKAVAPVGAALGVYEAYKGGEEGNAGKTALGFAGAIAGGAVTGGLLTSWSGPGAIVGGAIGGLLAGGAYLFGRSNKSKGDWFVESDQDARIHYGEMIIPSRVATAVREELSLGKTSPSATKSGSKGETTVNIFLTVQRATDQEAMDFATKVKRLIDSDRELLAVGAGRFSNG